jgi:hypothetical protein
MTERETFAARIRALRAKTVENGCTEGEALSAADMLAKLLRLYNMTLDEAEIRASPFENHKERHADEVGDRLWKIADACAFLTGARTWSSARGVYPIEVNFFGFSHEVEVARYMLEICAYAMRQEHHRLQIDAWPRVLKRSVLVPYLDGMADRLRSRIRAMKPPEPTGTGLMVIRNHLIDQAMPVKLQDISKPASRNLDPAYTDGLAAGDRVALNRGLRSAEDMLRLLG